MTAIVTTSPGPVLAPPPLRRFATVLTPGEPVELPDPLAALVTANYPDLIRLA